MKDNENIIELLLLMLLEEEEDEEFWNYLATTNSMLLAIIASQQSCRTAIPSEELLHSSFTAFDYFYDNANPEGFQKYFRFDRSTFFC